ncbi:hypothetical protein [Yoonia algicola]|uniref:Uncharacterized protein n=1 Tax=Yoonia algicola TaxID=3137368 RepID=A0AAN0M612_9RHOB
MSEAAALDDLCTGHQLIVGVSHDGRPGFAPVERLCELCVLSPDGDNLFCDNAVRGAEHCKTITQSRPLRGGRRDVENHIKALFIYRQCRSLGFGCR